MSSKSEAFVIDGDDLIRMDRKGGGKSAAGSQTVAFESQKAASPSSSRGSMKPAGAASLSLWVWGLGQWANGDRDLAALLFLWEGLIVAVHYLVAESWSSLRRMAHIFFISEWEMLLYCAAIDLWLVFLLLFNVSQAYRSAERQRGRCQGLRNPWLAGLTSIIIPGWGQILNGQLRKGLFFLFGFVVQAGMLGFYLLTPLYRVVATLDPNQGVLRHIIHGGQITLVITLQMWLLSIYDAVLVARYTRYRARSS